TIVTPGSLSVCSVHSGAKTAMRALRSRASSSQSPSVSSFTWSSPQPCNARIDRREPTPGSSPPISIKPHSEPNEHDGRQGDHPGGDTIWRQQGGWFDAQLEFERVGVRAGE